MLKAKLIKLFDLSINCAFAMILIFIVLALFLGSVQLFVSVWELIKFQGVSGHYIKIFSDVLTLYVLVELTRSLVEYFDTKKLKLTPIIDAAIVFIIRELMISLFKHSIDTHMIYALAAMLFVLGCLRASTLLTLDKDKDVTENH